MRNQPNVIHSPIASDTLLVKVKGQQEKQRVGKLLLEIPLRELHSLMVSSLEDGGLPEVRDADNKIIVSDTMLRCIIKEEIPELQKATDRHKQMCGCEVCISCASQLKSLNAWRYRSLRKLVAAAKAIPENSSLRMNADNKTNTFRQHFLDHDGGLKQEKPRHAVTSIMCPIIDGCGYPTGIVSSGGASSVLNLQPIMRRSCLAGKHLMIRSDFTRMNMQQNVPSMAFS